MKLSFATMIAALVVISTVTALPANNEQPVAEGLLTKRIDCCKYTDGSQYCGVMGCCITRKCTRYGGPAQCGYSGCCMSYNC
ncbi:hypothetical protein BC939DRAFT_505479 [Gamsiella multidivaricata]|uniref:uncharacterized protein n=1 Tax=Gamsiella multidivaricata TaxID=101098 RepID=UPI00221F0B22|nr:uncharacterized protein BC939DRAFT_505479 [Gamsiella multidivaricata]KAI7819838.1 hypothetical protein BC939DRAFT_505479 [Gamsiella multidivaricata]